MTLEGIRVHIAKFDETLKLYLFTKGDITAIEKNANEGEEDKLNNLGEKLEKYQEQMRNFMSETTL